MNKCNKIPIAPVVLILIGLIFLLNNMGIIPSGFSKLWPLLLIAVGVVKIANYYSGNKD